VQVPDSLARKINCIPLEEFVPDQIGRYAQSRRNFPFLRHNSLADDDPELPKILVWFTRDSLSLLKKEGAVVIFDGSFKIALGGYSQCIFFWVRIGNQSSGRFRFVDRHRFTA
jgi:hypothetical protein